MTLIPETIRAIAYDMGDRIALVNQNRSLVFPRAISPFVVGSHGFLILDYSLAKAAPLSKTRSVGFTNDVDGSATVVITDSFSDGSTIVTRWRSPPAGDTKLTIVITAGVTATYSLTISLTSGFEDAVLSSVGRKLVVSLGVSKAVFDLSDNMLGTVSGTTFTLSRRLRAGVALNIDPVVNGGGAGGETGLLDNPPGLRYSGARLFRDTFDKVLGIVGKASGNVLFIYSNDDGASFSTVDLGANAQCDGGSSSCTFPGPNGQNDVMVGWVNNTANTVKFARLTITRDGSNNITGASIGSVLTITPGKDARDMSVWQLHNGEAGALWTENSAAGGKSAKARFIRVVYGSPPTYKNAAGTASSIDDFTAYTGAHTFSFASVTQDPYDNALYAVWYHVKEQKVWERKATFSTPNWSWGTDSNLATGADPDPAGPAVQQSVGDSAFTPQAVLGTFHQPLANQKDRVFGITNGAAPAQLGGDNPAQYADFNAFGLASGNTAARTVIRVAADRLSVKIYKYSTWDGSAWASPATLIDESARYAVGGGSAKPQRSGKLEFLYATQEVADGVWTDRYVQKVFVTLVTKTGSDSGIGSDVPTRKTMTGLGDIGVGLDVPTFKGMIGLSDLGVGADSSELTILAAIIRRAFERMLRLRTSMGFPGAVSIVKRGVFHIPFNILASWSGRAGMRAGVSTRLMARVESPSMAWVRTGVEGRVVGARSNPVVMFGHMSAGVGITEGTGLSINGAKRVGETLNGYFVGAVPFTDEQALLIGGILKEWLVGGLGLPSREDFLYREEILKRANVENLETVWVLRLDETKGLVPEIFDARTFALIRHVYMKAKRKG